MGYYINLRNISISKYKDILKSADLLPSRIILKNDIDDIFNIIKKLQIDNVDELQKTLMNKNEVQDFSKKSGIPEDYLKILIREIKSYRQSPNKIKAFSDISENVILKLKNIGIKNTLQIYEKILTCRVENSCQIR